jgi:hypothetical protein
MGCGYLLAEFCVHGWTSDTWLKAIAARTVMTSPRRPCGSGALVPGCDGGILETVAGIQEHACIHATIP